MAQHGGNDGDGTRAGESRVRAVRRLALGAIAGLAVAAAALIAPGERPAALPDGTVALVNGTAVRQADYERAVGALATDRRNPVGDADRRYVLDRLVDEELLVQRAIELGLPRHDRRLRGELVAAVIEAVVREAEAHEPDAAELASWYEAHREWFARPGRLRVRSIWLSTARDGEAAASARAEDAVARLRAGEPFEAVAAALGDPAVAPPPADLLPPAKLTEYVGPAAVDALAGAQPGSVVGPVAGPGGWHVLWLDAREPAAVPALADVEREVLAEWRRRTGEEALRRHLDELRARAEVRVAEHAP